MDSDPRTVWCGNLPEEITEELLYELFLQAGPVERVSIPKECNGRFKPFGFITFKQECSVPYALDLLQGTTLFGMQLRMKPRCNQSQRRPDPISNSYQSGTTNATPMTDPSFLQPMMSAQLLNNQARLSNTTDNLTQHSLRGQWNRNQNSTQKVETKEKSNYNHNRKNNDSKYSSNRNNFKPYDRLRPDNEYDRKRDKKKRKMDKY